MKKTLFLLFFVFYLFQIKSFSQSIPNTDSCVTNYFIKFYNNPSLSLEPGAMVLDKNSVISCGLFRLGDADNHSDAYLVKLDPKGNIVWQKTFGGLGSQGLHKLIKLADGNFIASGVDATNTAIGNFLMKFDGDGNVIWRKDFGTTNNIENFSIGDLAESEDGSLILAALDIENTPLGNFRILFAKFDRDGNIILSKFFVPPYNAFGALMYPSSILIKNGFTYIAGNVVINALKGLLMKVDNATGQLAWTKVYDFNGGEAAFSQVLNYDSNKLCLIGVNKINPEDTSIIYIVDTSGTPSSTRFFRFNTSSVGEYGLYGAAVFDKDKNLIWTMKNLVDDNTRDMVIVKINPVGNVVWSKRHTQLKNHPRILGIAIAPDSSIYTAGYNLTTNDYLQLYLAKLDKNGEAGCAPQQIETSVGAGVSTVTNVDFTVAVKSIIQKSGVNTIVPDYLSLADSLCVAENVCTTIKLSAKDTFCGIKDTILVKVTKSSQCNVAPQFNYDPLKISYISFSDSTLKVVAKQPGSISITATLTTSCTVFQDSIMLTILAPPSMLTLGLDTFVCAGQVLRLHPNEAYKTYRWQDNSDKPFFDVFSPGKYYLTVSDYCGNVSSDTIFVSQATNHSFNFLSKYSKCDVDTLTVNVSTQLHNFTFDPDITIGFSAGSLKAWPAVNTSYLVHALTSQGCLISDSLRVIVNYSTPVFLGSDTTICQNDSVVLRAPPGLIDYTWSTGAKASQIKISTPGKYWITGVNNSLCKSSDTVSIYVNPLPPLFLGNDTSICANQSLQLKAGNGFSTYRWNDGSTAPNYNATKPGSYSVTVADAAGCINSDTIQLLDFKSLPANFLKEVDSVCIYEPKQIAATGTWSSYLWNNGATTPYITVSQPGLYTLQVQSREGCYGKDTIQLLNADCLNGIWFPTAFTPNGDGRNDLLKPIVHLAPVKYYYAVYNRFGQLVHQEDGASKGWDGNVKSVPQNSGTFVWYCIYQLAGQPEIMKKGTAVLIR